MIIHSTRSFLVMASSDFVHWNEHLERRFDDSAESGNVHLHVRLDNQERSYRDVDEYLAEFTVHQLTLDEAHTLAKLFPGNGAAHHASFGPQEIFQPFPGK